MFIDWIIQSRWKVKILLLIYSNVISPERASFVGVDVVAGANNKTGTEATEDKIWANIRLEKGQPSGSSRVYLLSSGRIQIPFRGQNSIFPCVTIDPIAVIKVLFRECSLFPRGFIFCPFVLVCA